MAFAATFYLTFAKDMTKAMSRRVAMIFGVMGTPCYMKSRQT